MWALSWYTYIQAMAEGCVDGPHKDRVSFFICFESVSNAWNKRHPEPSENRDWTKVAIIAAAAATVPMTTENIAPPWKWTCTNAQHISLSRTFFNEQSSILQSAVNKFNVHVINDLTFSIYALSHSLANTMTGWLLLKRWTVDGWSAR